MGAPYSNKKIIMIFHFRQIKKYCEICGKRLVLNNTRDIKRKRFCSKKCVQKQAMITIGYLIRYSRKIKRREFKHVTIAEQVLGRELIGSECVHHINMIKTDNRRSNLLICDHSYHKWLHSRYTKRFAELCLGGGG
jgi:S-adenosylmethionine:tRNA-ribosyltransferase-isomerase (queuine synthetase)